MILKIFTHLFIFHVWLRWVLVVAHGIFVKCAGGLVEVPGLSSLIGIESTSPALEGEFFFSF